MNKQQNKFINSLVIPGLFVLLIILVKIIENVFEINLKGFGLYPRNISGLLGIVSGPLIHSDFNHLTSNVFPILVLGTSITYFYDKSSNAVLLFSYLLTGSFVWVFARSSFHIGASGIVYSLASFLFFSGIIKKDKRSITLSLLVVFLYGGLAIGIFPIKEGVSWESHLIGGIVGLLLAVVFRKNDGYKKYDWEKEELQEDIRNLEISYKNGYQGKKG